MYLCSVKKERDGVMELPSIFNCSNDMALAANVRQYFPPKRILQMEEDLKELSRLWEGTRFAGPWGWSLATKQRYRQMGVDEHLLPSDSWLDEVRRLSSREFACEYIHGLLEVMKDNRLVGKEMTFSDKADIEICYPTIFKSPWSSSGRGVFVSEGLTKEQIETKLRGFVNTQGGYAKDRFLKNKVLDFAMEFYVNEDKTVEFLGYSVFHAAENGAYGYNVVDSQEALLRMIDVDEGLLNSLIEYHKEHLGRTAYHGPVGIDMLKTAEGLIHPCIEINLRMNMGILAIILSERYCPKSTEYFTICRNHGFQALIDEGKLMIIFKK